jgi:hypothetical protein
MKKTLILALASLAMTSPAFAGFGSTGAIPLGGSGSADLTSILAAAQAGKTVASSSLAGAPTLDYRAKGWLVQAPVLDILGSALDETDGTDLGLAVSYGVHHKKIAEETEGVFMPGAHFVHTAGGNAFGVHARLGGEMKKGAGFGLYVVPKLGVHMEDGGDTHFTTGGALEFSAWFAK